jgi:hypothetical protein
VRCAGGVASLQEARKRALESPRTKVRNELTQPQSRFHGSGARWLSPTERFSSRLLVPRALPQPDPLGHLSSWTRDGPGWIVRSRQARALGACRLRLHLSSSLARSSTRPRNDPLSRAIRLTDSLARSVSQRQRSLARTSPRSRAASRAPPRRGARSAAPKVPSVGGPPHSGWGVVHRLSPPCGLSRRLFDLLSSRGP